jgi:hypothetical protein
MPFTIKKGITTLPPWATKKVFLSDFLNKHQHRTINQYNLLYVIQSRSDVTNGVYKIGVSSGRHRLGECVKHHGGSR